MHDVVHAAKPEAIFIAAVQLMESLDTIRPGGWDIDYWLAVSGCAHFRMPAAQYRAMVARAFRPSIWHRSRRTTAVDDRELFLSVVAAVCVTRSGEPPVDRAAVCEWREHMAAHQRRLFRSLRPSQSRADARSHVSPTARWEPYFDGRAVRRRRSRSSSRGTRRTTMAARAARPLSRFRFAAGTARCRKRTYRSTCISDKLIDARAAAALSCARAVQPRLYRR